MWGSWLDHLQKKLDDVSGLAERVVSVEYYQSDDNYPDEEEEEEEEGGEPVKDGVASKLESRSDHITDTSREQQPVRGRRERRIVSEAAPHAEENHWVDKGQMTQDTRTKFRVVASSEEDPHAMPQCPLADETLVSNSSNGAVGLDEENAIRTESAQILLLPPPPPPASAADGSMRAANDTSSASSSTSGCLVAFPTTKSVKHDTSYGKISPVVPPHEEEPQSSKKDSDNGEGQLLRFQQLLAEEMETSRALREENERHLRDKAALAKELATLHQLTRSAEDSYKLEALEREGIELSTRLGKERERNKQLQETKAKLEERILSLEGKVAQSLKREEQLQQAVEATRAEREAVDRVTRDIGAHEKELEAHVSELHQLLSDAKRSHEELAARHEEELSRHKRELSHERKSASDRLELLQREKDGLVSSLERTQAEYERRIEELENKLFQANRRADQAETRLTEHERGSLVPLREFRSTLEDMERQRRHLMEEKAYAVEECTVVKRNRMADSENFMRRLSEMQTEVHTLQEEKREVEQELLQWKGRQSQMQKALQEALERASHAEATNNQLTAALEEAKLRMESDNDRGSKNTNHNGKNFPGFSLDLPWEPTKVMAASPTLVGGGSIQLSSFQLDRGEDSADVSRGGRGRVERELVRQAVEIERLRRVEADAADTKERLSALASQHDLLMQMYGQLQEELQRQQQGTSQHVR